MSFLLLNVNDSCICVIREFFIFDKVWLLLGSNIKLVMFVIVIEEFLINMLRFVVFILLKFLLRIVKFGVVLDLIVMWFVVFCLIIMFEDLDENDVILCFVML